MGFGTPPAKFDIYDKFREFIPWLYLDPNAFTVTVDNGGAVAARTPELSMGTGAVAGYKAFVCTYNPWRMFLDTGKLIVAEWVLTQISSTSNVTIILHLNFDYSAPPDETYSHIGFKIINTTLYASNADDFTQKITDTGVMMVAGYKRTRLMAVLNPGANCKFYVNGVLKVIHTENLPVEPEYYLNVGIITNTTTSKYLRLNRFLLEKQPA